jgi:type II secretory pathway component HofQ
MLSTFAIHDARAAIWQKSFGTTTRLTTTQQLSNAVVERVEWRLRIFLSAHQQRSRGKDSLDDGVPF